MTTRKAAQIAVKPELFPLFLYKRILRLHYGLPPAARVMGDIYVKDEFRRHKNVEPAHAKVFLTEWMDYCGLLSKQLSSSGIVKGFIGKDLSSDKLDALAEEQLTQLLELKIEAESHLGKDDVMKKLKQMEAALDK